MKRKDEAEVVVREGVESVYSLTLDLREHRIQS